MILKDYHVHSTYSDGKNTPEEIVLQAISLGMSEIGFSDHCYGDYCEEYCIAWNKLDGYAEEINRLKDKYKDKISVLLGIEQDYYSEASTEPYDYVIGSVHFVKVGDTYVEVDGSREEQIQGVKLYFGGDYKAFYRAYFANVKDVVNKTGCDIIGHFDLVSKFNGLGDIFDENDPDYIAAWKDAADTLLESGKVFEINTGAVSRGYRSQPYPSKPIFDYLKSKGAKFILSSDAHKKENLCFLFEKFVL